jgi:hypothetical protein
MIISIGTEKTLDKIQYPIIIKAQKKEAIKCSYLNIEAIYDKFLAKVYEMEKNKVFPLKERKRQGCLFSLLLFNILLEFLPRAISQKK